MEPKITQFLDEEGRVKQLPSKKIPRLAVLRHLAGKFERNRQYTEHEINELITQWNTIGDYFILRRELVDSHLMGRTPDGRQYWRNMPSEEEGVNDDGQPSE